MNWRNVLRKAALTLVIVGVMAFAKVWYDTMRDPVVERLTVESMAMAPGQKPVTIALLADIHVAGPDMPPSRLAEIVEHIIIFQVLQIAVGASVACDIDAAVSTAEQARVALDEFAYPGFDE